MIPPSIRKKLHCNPGLVVGLNPEDQVEAILENRMCLSYIEPMSLDVCFALQDKLIKTTPMHLFFLKAPSKKIVQIAFEPIAFEPIFIPDKFGLFFKLDFIYNIFLYKLSHLLSERGIRKVEMFITDELDVLQQDISRQLFFKMFKHFPPKWQAFLVRHDAYLFPHLENPTTLAKWIAVNMVPNNIRFIKDPSEALQINAVKREPMAIAWIKKPTPKVQMIAVNAMPELAFAISNPTAKVKKLKEIYNELNEILT